VGLRSLASAASPFVARASEATSSGIDAAQVYQQVTEYYGTQLTTNQGLCTNVSTPALASVVSLPSSVRQILEAIPEAITDKSCGCGFPIPLGIHGLHALDLGCGSGRDAYALAALMGPMGSVTGIDLTPSLVQVAQQNLSTFTRRLPTPPARLHFAHGYIEYLDQAGIETETIDLAIANFALSLTPDKTQAMREIFRVLCYGGEFQFSDLFASRRVPAHVRDHDVLFCEGLGGALYLDDFVSLCREVGFGEPRLVRVEKTPIEITTDETLAASVAAIQYQSLTFRCFKVPGKMEMHTTEQDYGHVAKYLGTIPGHEGVYVLDSSYRFETRRPVRIGGNTAAILTDSWLARHFHVDGDFSEHFGRFTQTGSGATIM
jgi:arsenite methyltransferase